MSQTWTDEALRRWRETRDPEALGELLKSRRERAYSVAWHLLRSASDAEDVVQEAFLKLLSRTVGFDDAATFEVTVYRAVVQCALDALRKRARRRMRETAGLEAEPDTERAGAMQTRAAEEEKEEVQSLLRQAVADLPEEERVPVVLCYYQGLSVAESARTLEMPRGTLRARLAKALHHLRTRLSAQDKKKSSAMILALLWQDGVRPVPHSLSARLDELLPGRPCAELPRLPQPGPAASALSAGPWQARGLSGVAFWTAAAVILAASVGVGMLAHKERLGNGTVDFNAREMAASPVPRNTGSKSTAFKQEAVPEGSSVEPSRSVWLQAGNDPTEEEFMNTKLSALALAGSLLLPGAVQAGEASPEVATVIAQIEARRAAKSEAEAKAAASRQGREKGGREEGGVRVYRQPSAGSPGAPVVIEMGE